MFLDFVSFVLSKLKGCEVVYGSLIERFFVHQVLGPTILSAFLWFNKQNNIKNLFFSQFKLKLYFLFFYFLNDLKFFLKKNWIFTFQINFIYRPVNTINVIFIKRYSFLKCCFFLFNFYNFNKLNLILCLLKLV